MFFNHSLSNPTLGGVKSYSLVSQLFSVSNELVLMSRGEQHSNKTSRVSIHTFYFLLSATFHRSSVYLDIYMEHRNVTACARTIYPHTFLDSTPGSIIYILKQRRRKKNSRLFTFCYILYRRGD